jgi:hypothetical protein
MIRHEPGRAVKTMSGKGSVCGHFQRYVIVSQVAEAAFNARKRRRGFAYSPSSGEEDSLSAVGNQAGVDHFHPAVAVP